MHPRSYLPEPERRARSRLTQLLHRPFLCGSLVTMNRTCGKPGCKCTRGELHQGLCVALKVGDQRKMIHVPKAMEQTVRQWVSNYQEAWQLMEKISSFGLKRLVQTKERLRGGRRS
jgi:hypothetical protein